MKDDKNFPPAACKILVVDDDADISEMVKYVLEKDGYTVRTHDTGLYVKEIVEDQKPDLVLLDINLPGKSGTEICKEIKKNKSIPVIFFSAHADEVTLFKECQADGFLAKPFDIKELVDVIKSKLE